MSNYKNLAKLNSLMGRLNTKILFIKDYSHDLEPKRVEKLVKLVEKALKLPLFPDKVKK